VGQVGNLRTIVNGLHARDRLKPAAGLTNLPHHNIGRSHWQPPFNSTGNSGYMVSAPTRMRDFRNPMLYRETPG